jgi:hypothetical protein
VSRNVALSGDGKSWAEAFLTIGEAIAAVNADYAAALYPTRGRNSTIYIDEGWYSEVGVTLTASDVTIISVAPGSRDNTVWYGSATAGGFDAGAVVPVLTITGGNNTIINMDFMNSASGLYPCVVVGGLAAAAYANKFVNCNFPRDVADAYTFSVLCYDLEGTEFWYCGFSQSALTAGIKILSDGVVNPVNVKVIDCDFCGTPIGIHQVAGHNTVIRGNWFYDASDDRPDTIDNPCYIEATSAFMVHNVAPNNTLAEFNGGAAGVELANICSDSAAANYPA